MRMSRSVAATTVLAAVASATAGVAGSAGAATSGNLVTNPSYAAGTTGWAGGANTTFTVAATGYAGTQGATLAPVAAGNVSVTDSPDTVAYTTAGATYTATVRVKNPVAGTTVRGAVSLQERVSGTQAPLAAATPFTLSDTSWRTVSVSGIATGNTAGETGAHGLGLQVVGNALTKTQKLLVDDWTLTRTDPNVAPTPAFTATTSYLTTSFDAAASTDTDGTIASYSWDFGDGTTGRGRLLSHTYATPGPRTVTLTVTDDDGAARTLSKTVQPVENVAPAAAFSSTGSYLTARLDASGSSDTDGTLSTYAWDFGDGTTGAGRVVSHTYPTAGSYDVTLAVTDDAGATTSVVKPVTVVANVAPTGVVNATSDYLVAKLNAAGSTDSDGTIRTYAWDFGDGTTAQGSWVTHTYDAAGTYAVVLRLTDNAGATTTVRKSVTVAANVAPTAAFTSARTYLAARLDGSGSGDPDGSVVSYAWDFGDGTTGTGRTTTHAYDQAGTYTVALTVKDDQGATHTVRKAVTVVANVPPTAVLNASTSYLVGKFNTAGSADSDGTIRSTTWDFGDGTTDQGSWVTHAYDAPGTYTVTLTLTDNGGAVTRETTQVTVVANVPPAVKLATAARYLTVAVDAAGSTDSDGRIVSYQWSFGDGIEETGRAASHTYLAGGEYPVSVTVTDEGGAQTTVTRTVRVTPNVAPSASFVTSSGYRTARFDAARSSDSDGTLTSYAWDYGDGSVGEGSWSSHTYKAAGTYTVTLTVTDDFGATAVHTLPATVTQGPAVRLGVYNGYPSLLPDEATIADFGAAPQVSSTYYASDEKLHYTYETARIRRGTSPNITVTTRGTQLINGIATGDPGALAWLDGYVAGLARLAAVDPRVPVYATIDHEFLSKVNSGAVTGASADPLVYAKALSVFYAKAEAASSNIVTTLWMVGYDRQFEGTIGAALTVRPDVVTIDPYARTATDSVMSIAQQDLDWIRSQAWYDDQPIALTEFAMPVNLGDAAMARFYTGVRSQLDAMGVSWAVLFNRPRDKDYLITTGSYPSAVTSFSASLKT